MTMVRGAHVTADRLLREQLHARALAELDHPHGRIVPDRWISDPHWRCIYLHVSNRFTRDRHGLRVCVVCDFPVHLTFPEDVSGPLEIEHSEMWA